MIKEYPDLNVYSDSVPNSPVCSNIFFLVLSMVLIQL